VSTYNLLYSTHSCIHFFVKIKVFTLLEQIYGSFDSLAKRRGVFKVETIGDCYVAVTGLPHPREDHAIAMARFARDCIFEMNETVNKLEVLLG
jgi:class 3 adenylate cyclase